MFLCLCFAFDLPSWDGGRFAAAQWKKARNGLFCTSWKSGSLLLETAALSRSLNLSAPCFRVHLETVRKRQTREREAERKKNLFLFEHLILKASGYVGAGGQSRGRASPAGLGGDRKAGPGSQALTSFLHLGTN